MSSPPTACPTSRVPRKLEAIRADAAGHPFCYMANEAVDLSVWQGAQAAVVVSSSEALRRRVREATRIEAEVDVPKARLRDLLYGIRVHQWLKNLLVFVPLLPMMNALTQSMVVARAGDVLRVRRLRVGDLHRQRPA